MSDANAGRLGRTVLHAWHAANGGKIVPFAGWEMPVQYKTGIIAEHLATRRRAGLFDVSHMGRFRINGPGAEAFALRVLTNNAQALEPGQAQYTFIANTAGGAIDDAYLYRLRAEEFLLVVNAGNRDRDWAWLSNQTGGTDVSLTDQSDEIGMVSVQGPHSTEIMEALVGAGALPENKRNRLSRAQLNGDELIIARSGYTGEPVCFEIFAPHDATVALWERLVELGGAPCGLGARDSLRLEAGLPLYGHEFGTDPEGREIPIFANSLARFAVRPPAGAPGIDYVGRVALERQREEFIQIKRGELDNAEGPSLLPRLVQPVAVFDGKRPLRAGYRVSLDGTDVGWITSGTTVPYSRFYGGGITAVPGDEHDLRPIGLALVDARLRYRSDRPVVLEVTDARGNTFEAELVERNLWPTAPYARTYAGFEAPAVAARVDDSDLPGLAARLRTDTADNHTWRRESCINLIPSEQCTSAFVNELCVSNPAGRYNEHNRLRALGPNAPEIRYYKGTAFSMQKEEELKAALRTFFDCSHVEPRVISGQMANDTVYDALKAFRNRHRSGPEARLLGPVLVHDLTKGGHLSAQIGGALKNYVGIDRRTGRPAVLHFPFERDCPHRIDVEATKEMIAEGRPELIVFGRSVIVHTEPVAEIARFVHDLFGRDNPRRPLIMYDGAHVLGLLGPHFQDPLAEGADVVTGSTHKTFFGPQRGVVLANVPPGSAFEEWWRFIEKRAFPGHVSNHHLGTLLGLLGATYEMLRFKDEYQRKVIENAKAFAAGLVAEELVLKGDPACGYTETHQVLLRGARSKGEYLSHLLEANGIITNPQAYHDDPSFAAASGVRMGSQEMTRFGMGTDDFRQLARLLATIIREGGTRPSGHWRDQVRELRVAFREMRYSLA